MLKKKKTTASGKLVLVKSVRRTRSHRMKFCVQKGLGGAVLNKQAERKITEGFSSLRGAVALANIFCWAAALLYAQMASKSVTFSMPFFINAVHSQASLSACLISGCFVFNYQNLCPF